jgi:hypothetical protein
MYLISFCLLLSQVLAFGKSYPWGMLPWDLGRVFWIVLSLAFLVPVIHLTLKNEKLSVVFTQWSHKIAQILQKRAWLLILVLSNAIFQLFNYFHFRHLGYQFPVLSLITSLLIAIWIRYDRPILAYSLNLLLLVYSIYYFPLTGFRSDMLSVIENGLRLWSQGESPYQLIQFPWGPSRMPYFPGMLFSHFPAWALGLDLRWNSLLYRFLWMILLAKSPSRKNNGLIFFFVLNPYFNLRHDLYFDFFLLLTALFFSFKKLRSIWIPWMAVTWQWALPIMPILAWNWIWRKKDEVLKNLLLLIASSTGILALIVSGLWKTTSLKTFAGSAFFAFDLGELFYTYKKDYGLTLAPLLYWLNQVALSKYLQTGVCIILFLLYIKGNQNKTQSFCRYSSCTLILFVMLSVHFWQYFWILPTFWMIWCLQESDCTL